MAGKSKSGFGFKSGFNNFCQIQWIWIWIRLDLSFLKPLNLDLKFGLDLDLNIAGFARH